MTRIYGASDDLVEIDGDINDEHGEYDFKGKVSASDGTEALLKYNNDGQWEFTIKNKGDKFYKLIEAVGDDAEHTDPDANQCTSYSDVLILNDLIEWVKIGRKKYKP